MISSGLSRVSFLGCDLHLLATRELVLAGIFQEACSCLESSSWQAISVTHTCKGARLVTIANVCSLFSLNFLSPSLTVFPVAIFKHLSPLFSLIFPESFPRHSLPFAPISTLDIFKQASVFGEGALSVLTQM